MENILSQKGRGRLIGILSIGIPIVVFLLIINWLFKITPYQQLQGMPLLIAPFTSLIGIVLSWISLKTSPNSLARLGMVMNAILFLSPFLYWTVGAFFFGP